MYLCNTDPSNTYIHKLPLLGQSLLPWTEVLAALQSCMQWRVPARWSPDGDTVAVVRLQQRDRRDTVMAGLWPGLLLLVLITPSHAMKRKPSPKRPAQQKQPGKARPPARELTATSLAGRAAPCPALLTLQEGDAIQLTSPGYPAPYPNQYNCRWDLQAVRWHIPDSGVVGWWAGGRSEVGCYVLELTTRLLDVSTGWNVTTFTPGPPAPVQPGDLSQNARETSSGSTSSSKLFIC